MSNGAVVFNANDEFASPQACADLKAQHDVCFLQWMRDKFLPGIATQDDCKGVWQEYQGCLDKKLSAMGLSHLKRKEGQTAPDLSNIELRADVDTTHLIRLEPPASESNTKK